MSGRILIHSTRLKERDEYPECMRDVWEQARELEHSVWNQEDVDEYTIQGIIRDYREKIHIQNRMLQEVQNLMEYSKKLEATMEEIKMETLKLLETSNKIKKENEELLRRWGLL